MTIIKKRKKIVRADNKTESHWDRIKGGEGICFVCDKKIRPAQERKFIGYHKTNGAKLYRHQYCESGSANWCRKFGGRLYLKHKDMGDKK